VTLRTSYTLLAPVYDAVVEPLTAAARRENLALLPQTPDADVLLVGVGSGLDLPLLRAALPRPRSDPGDAGARPAQGRRRQPRDPAR